MPPLQNGFPAVGSAMHCNCPLYPTGSLLLGLTVGLLTGCWFGARGWKDQNNIREVLRQRVAISVDYAGHHEADDEQQRNCPARPLLHDPPGPTIRLPLPNIYPANAPTPTCMSLQVGSPLDPTERA